MAWEQVSEYRWRRSDGAVVRWDQRSPHVNPGMPSSLMWTAWEPDPSEQYLGKGNGRLSWPRRWKTAQAAMRVVDSLYPLPKLAAQ